MMERIHIQTHKAGPSRSGVCLEGRIVRVRDRAPQQAEEGKGGGKTKGKGKGKSAKKGTSEGFEAYLVSGPTPGDVIMCEAWEPGVRARVKELATTNKCVRLSNYLVKAHNTKTSVWTTSRCPDIRRSRLRCRTRQLYFFVQGGQPLQQ